MVANPTRACSICSLGCLLINKQFIVSSVCSFVGGKSGSSQASYYPCRTLINNAYSHFAAAFYSVISKLCVLLISAFLPRLLYEASTAFDMCMVSFNLISWIYFFEFVYNMLCKCVTWCNKPEATCTIERSGVQAPVWKCQNLCSFLLGYGRWPPPLSLPEIPLRVKVMSAVNTAQRNGCKSLDITSERLC